MQELLAATRGVEYESSEEKNQTEERYASEGTPGPSGGRQGTAANDWRCKGKEHEGMRERRPLGGHLGYDGRCMVTVENEYSVLDDGCAAVDDVKKKGEMRGWSVTEVAPVNQYEAMVEAAAGEARQPWRRVPNEKNWTRGA